MRTHVLGIPAYPAVAAVAGPVDLAVVVTPGANVPGVVRECAEAGVEAAIVISAGFREIGGSGAALERRDLEEARAARCGSSGPTAWAS